MNSQQPGSIREKRRKWAHIIAGFAILLHAYEKYESGHKSYIFFAVAGLVFISIALFHSAIAKKASWIDGIFFIIEGILSGIVALDFFHAEKMVLPWIYLLLAAFQFFIAFRKSKIKAIRQ